jgi:hypothetical protein
MTITYEPELPWLEDTLYPYYQLMVRNTFPKNDFLTIFLGCIHVFAFMMIHLGIWLPPKILIFYVFYIAIIYLTYQIFDQNCFLTILSSISSDTNQMPIIVRMSNASRMLMIYLGIAIIGVLIPSLAPFSLLKNLILFMDGL